MRLGARAPRNDAAAKTTGIALYPGDCRSDDELHAKVVFSGQPHARMLSMDLSAADAVAGVIAIFTASDVPVNEYGLTLFDQPVMVGLNDTKRTEVASDVSRWEADQIAFVVAESAEAASAAAEAIVVEWEQLPIVADIDAALADNAPLIHPESVWWSRGYDVADRDGVGCPSPRRRRRCSAHQNELESRRIDRWPPQTAQRPHPRNLGRGQERQDHRSRV
jgi:CO/xanthine dehydrogenase Mo-binding subunit